MTYDISYYVKPCIGLLRTSERRCRSRFCPLADFVPPGPGHNLLAEIVPHRYNPLADIVPIAPHPPPPPPPFSIQPMLGRPGFFGVRSYKLFASSQKGKFSTHTLPLSLPLPTFSPAVLLIYLPARRPGCGHEYCPHSPSN